MSGIERAAQVITRNSEKLGSSILVRTPKFAWHKEFKKGHKEGLRPCIANAANCNCFRPFLQSWVLLLLTLTGILRVRCVLFYQKSHNLVIVNE